MVGLSSWGRRADSGGQCYCAATATASVSRKKEGTATTAAAGSGDDAMDVDGKEWAKESDDAEVGGEGRCSCT